MHNRILKTTLRRLLQCEELDAGMREPLRNTYFRLADVDEVPLTRRLFEAVQLHRNIRFYRFLLDVCRLLFDLLIPDKATGKLHFEDFIRNEKKMHRLFEKFLCNFYTHETDYRVRRQRRPWANTVGADAAARELLPRLNPDILLDRPGRTIILDAKYYRNVLQCHPKGRALLHSGHLYQMFAYLKTSVPLQGEARSRECWSTRCLTRDLTMNTRCMATASVSTQSTSVSTGQEFAAIYSPWSGHRNKK